MIPSKGEHGHEDDNMINKNESMEDQQRNYADGDQDRSNVDHNKPQFERSDMNANQEQRAGSGGSGKTSDKNPGNR
jgi:hypothetical protein